MSVCQSVSLYLDFYLLAQGLFSPLTWYSAAALMKHTDTLLIDTHIIDTQHTQCWVILTDIYTHLRPSTPSITYTYTNKHIHRNKHIHIHANGHYDIQYICTDYLPKICWRSIGCAICIFRNIFPTLHFSFLNALNWQHNHWISKSSILSPL